MTHITDFQTDLWNLINKHVKSGMCLSDVLKAMRRTTKTAESKALKNIDMYVKFCVICDREGLPLISFASYLKNGME